MKLQKYQIEGAQFLANNYHALLADDMGLGKTAQAIKACEDKENILVICPASVKYHWKNEFEKWADKFSEVVEGRKFEINKYYNIIIVNYELLLSKYIFKQLKYREWDVLILDEGHYLKSLTSKRSKLVLGRDGLARNSTYKWVLTGTPIENNPIDLFPMLYVLAPTFDCRKPIAPYISSYEMYVMKYCNGYYDAYTDKPMPNGSSNELELKKQLSNFMLRRTLEKDLPDVLFQVISMKKNNKVNLLENRLSEEEYFKPMAELGALASVRQEIALAKLPQSIEYIKDMLKTVDKLVIFAYHRSVIQNLGKALNNFQPVLYYGGMHAKSKEKSKNNFINRKNCKIIIMQIKAGGTGLDGLQKVCHHMLFVEVDWIPFKQCIGRLKRKGQKAQTVIVQMLVTQDSIEQQILGSAREKVKTIKTILGD